MAVNEATKTAIERGALTHPDVTRLDDVNRDVLKVLSRPGKGWWALFALAAAGVGLFFFSWITQMVRGIGVSGLNGPV
ncbi:MAG: hypothetical protein PVH96_15970, partial [Gemmatimonadota bacterium]